MGFYTDPYSDYGRLEGDIWRAIRLVVDTGVHSEHWNRQQMVDYFHAHSSIDEPDVQAEVDRYIAIPSQALGYKIGQLKFLELRAKAQKALGAEVRHPRIPRHDPRFRCAAAGRCGAAGGRVDCIAAGKQGTVDR